MLVVSSALIGETVTITLYVYDADDNLTDPDGYPGEYPMITIRKGETKYVSPVVVSDMDVHQSLGTFVYNWDTTGCQPGLYTVTARSVVDGLVRTPQKEFTLLSPGT